MKEITIDLEAYEVLCRHTRGGQSFSDVIKEHLGGKMTGQVLARLVAELHVSDSTLAELDALIEGRG